MLLCRLVCALIIEQWQESTLLAIPCTFVMCMYLESIELEKIKVITTQLSGCHSLKSQANGGVCWIIG